MNGTRKEAYRPLFAALLLSIGLAAADSAEALVNLVWRADASTVCVGDTVRIRLYAASDNPEQNDFFIAGNIGFAWDQLISPNYPTPPTAPIHLQFTGIDNAGSVFRPPTGPQGLTEILCPDIACQANEQCTASAHCGTRPCAADGEGFYRCTAALGRVITAPPDGTLLTTFLFRAIAPTPSAKVEVLFRSHFCFTIVYDEQTPNLNILNQMTGYGSIPIAINNCGGCNCPGDLDSSGAKNGQDAQEFVKCVLGSSTSCTCADMDNSGAVNSADVSLFVTSLLNGSACL